MKPELLSHRGYTGTVEYDEGEDIFSGRIEGIPERVSYGGVSSFAHLDGVFRKAVDDYIEGLADSE